MAHGHAFWDVLYMYNTDHVMAGPEPFSAHSQKKDSIFL